LADTAVITLGVNETHANHPVWFEQKHDAEHLELHFHRYEERVPHHREFDVPNVCH
jgi:hypothetical protein